MIYLQIGFSLVGGAILTWLFAPTAIAILAICLCYPLMTLILITIACFARMEPPPGGIFP